MEMKDAPNTDRLFPLQGDGYSFETGHCADGRQVIMGLLCPHLVLFYFDERGNLIRKENHVWELAAPLKNGIYQIYDAEFTAAFAQQKKHWKTERGFQTGIIRIKSFFDEEEWVGIHILPDHYLDLENPDDFEDEEERLEMIRSRDAWLERGDFVWWWAKDYYMNAEGEIEST